VPTAAAATGIIFFAETAKTIFVMNEIAITALVVLLVILALVATFVILVGGAILVFIGFRVWKLLQFLKAFKPELIFVLETTTFLLRQTEDITWQFSRRLNDLKDKIDLAGTNIESIKIPKPSLNTTPLADALPDEIEALAGDFFVLTRTTLEEHSVFEPVKTALHDSSVEINKGCERVVDVSNACKTAAEKLEIITNTIEALEI
jgi:hypothetical protein